MNSRGTALLYSTFLGGSGSDAASAIRIGPDGALFLAGQTSSSDFPGTHESLIQSSVIPQWGFVAKLNSLGTTILYSTYLEGPAAALAVNSVGSAYVTGTVFGNFSASAGAFQSGRSGASDAFIAKLSPDGSRRLFATLLGGSGADRGLAIAVDSKGNSWIAGSTTSVDFPAGTSGQTGSAFLALINSDGSTVAFSSLLGAFLPDQATGVLLDAAGNAFVSGSLEPQTLSKTRDALETGSCSAEENFIQKWNPQGVLLYSSFSREGLPVAIDDTQRLYLAGFSGNFFGHRSSAHDPAGPECG